MKSITLSGGPSGISLKNGMRPTSLRVAKSLTIQVTNGLITIAARDGDGNLIACLVRHEDLLMVAKAWRTCRQFPVRGVEDLYLDLARDVGCPYDIISKLDNVKTVYIAWVLGRVEKVIKKVAETISRPHRESRSPDPQRLRMGRWVGGWRILGLWLQGMICSSIT